MLLAFSSEELLIIYKALSDSPIFDEEIELKDKLLDKIRLYLDQDPVD